MDGRKDGRKAGRTGGGNDGRMSEHHLIALYRVSIGGFDVAVSSQISRICRRSIHVGDPWSRTPDEASRPAL